ncbi:MAG: hypothetical protein AB8C02_11390 [Halioglobus sp.]
MKFIWALLIQLQLFHADQRGDNENLGRLLLLALVLIPLILLIAVFGGEIYEAAQTAWEEVIDTDIT